MCISLGRRAVTVLNSILVTHPPKPKAIAANCVQPVVSNKLPNNGPDVPRVSRGWMEEIERYCKVKKIQVLDQLDASAAEGHRVNQVSNGKKRECRGKCFKKQARKKVNRTHNNIRFLGSAFLFHWAWECLANGSDGWWNGRASLAFRRVFRVQCKSFQLRSARFRE